MLNYDLCSLLILAVGVDVPLVLVCLEEIRPVTDYIQPLCLL